MYVENKGNYIRNFRDGRLVPGMNDVTQAEWDEFLSHPLNRHLVEIGEIVPKQKVVQRVTVDAEGNELGTTEVAQPIGLADMTVPEAEKVIAETFSKDLLGKFREEEAAGHNRTGVMKAIEKQLKSFEAPKEDKTEEV